MIFDDMPPKYVLGESRGPKRSARTKRHPESMNQRRAVGAPSHAARAQCWVDRPSSAAMEVFVEPVPRSRPQALEMAKSGRRGPRLDLLH